MEDHFGPRARMPEAAEGIAAVPGCELQVGMRSADRGEPQPAQPLVERTGLYRLLTDQASLWINLDSPAFGVVAGKGARPGIVALPPDVEPLTLFGPALAAAVRSCPGCGTSTVLLLGIRGGGQLFSYVHRGDGRPLMRYHLALQVGDVPDEGLARPIGLVLGAAAGELGLPAHLARTLWAGEDDRPVGWSRVPVERGGVIHRALRRGPRFFAFDRPPGLSASKRWLRLDPERPRDRELLSCRLAEDYDGAVVRRLHAAEGGSIGDMEII